MAAPATPTISASVGDHRVTLSGSAFSDPDGDNHRASEWQVIRQGGSFTSPLFSTGVDTSNLESVLIWGFPANEPFEARVRYQDDTLVWGAWSSPTSFTPTGIVDACPINTLLDLRVATAWEMI